MTSGNMNDIHCPKLMLRCSCSLRACRAMALGGVPIGVAIPPILAAIGMLIVSAMRPFPLAGRAAKTGVRKVSIMAAVAVLDTNIEKTPVMSRKPNSTFSLLLPKGRIRFLASSTSRPDLVAAMARMKPPRKSMMTGLAKVAMMSLDLRSSPKASPSPLKQAMELSDRVRHITDMMASEVAQEGMASNSHERVAKTKMAITRCWITVRPSMPKQVIGRFQMMAVTAMMPSSCHTFFISILFERTFSSDIIFKFLVVIISYYDVYECQVQLGRCISGIYIHVRHRRRAGDAHG